ncbi:MAG: hypothetical protein ABI266_09730 [Ginsengibacter sp.]
MNEENETAIDLIKESRKVIEDPFSTEKKTHFIFLINELILRDFSALVQLLYRIDVDEKKLKKVLSDNPSGDSASIIADMIIERQDQKAKSRNAFRQENTSDEELW